MKPRARSHAAKQEKSASILEAALKLFSEHGFSGTTVEMITSAVDLSPGAFYVYFQSKLEIYRTLNAIGIDILKENISRAISWPGQGALSKLSAIAAAYHHFYCEHKEYYQVMAILHLGQKAFFRDLDMVVFLEEKTMEVLKVIAAIIEEGRAAGEIGPVDGWKTAVAFWGMVDGIILLEERNNTSFVKLSLDDLIKQMITMTFSGIAAKTSSQTRPKARS